MNSKVNWKVEDNDGICFLTLDARGREQNVLSTQIMEELDKALDLVEDSNSRGLIIRSGKEKSFISGADIAEFKNFDSPERVLELTRFAGTVLHRIESMAIPTVAEINGHCLGGGLELALACDYRITVDSQRVRLGLPEVRLGIHPGFGGTIRLVELCGSPTALDLVLSGRTISPRTANKLGIVDFSVPQRQLESTARFVLDRKPPHTKAGFMLRLLNYSPARTVISLILRRRLEKKIPRSHYPAPFSVIDFWQEHGGNRKAMFEAEQESISRLFTTDTSRNLVRVFYLQEALKSRGRRGGPVFDHVHVIGAGTMGGDIASWCAMSGLRVTIHDRDPDALARATQRAWRLFQSRLKPKRLADRAMDRFGQDTSGAGAARADIIIEAIVEDADIKKAVFRDLEKIARPDAILATNTSSISLEIIAKDMKKPGRLVGLHFFNPVAKMQLVEVVYGHKTYKKYRQSAAAFCGQIGRLPVAVKSSPGFLVNRVLMPYTLEAVALLNEGAAAQKIDLAATSFGMPMGPLALADTVGLDICLDVAENLASAYNFEIPDLLRDHVRKGRLGKKSGKGFYTWKKGTPATAKPKFGAKIDTKDDMMQQRLIFRFLNECVACLDETIAGDRDDLDAALVFGTGFAPFRGGPVNYLLSEGVEQKLQALHGLQQQFGERFTPHPGWKNLVNSGIDDQNQ